MTFKELRKTKFKTAKELAEMLNMPAPRIRKWECGKSAPKKENLSKVAKALGVSVEQLLNCFER